MSRWVLRALAGLLLIAFLVVAYSESALKSATSDEPPHLASGLAYVERGSFYGNPQHPPLLKEISGLSMMLGGLRLPRNTQTDIFLQGKAAAIQPEWEVGNAILAGNGPDRTLFWARLPFPLLGVLIGLLLYVWGRQVVGETAAVGAVFLFALDPTVLAHSFLVTTDIGVAAFTLLFLFTLWHYVRKPNWKRLACCGLALGAVLCAKFSAVLLLPVVGVLLLVGFTRPTERAEPAARRDDTPKSLATVNRNAPCPCGSGKKFKKCHGASDGATARPAMAIPPELGRQALRCGAIFLGMCAIAYLTIQAIYFFPRDPFVYIEGLRRVNADHIKGYLYMMAGEVRQRFWSYFAVAYLLKEPLANILLAAIGLAALARTRTVPLIGKLFLLLPPIVLFLGPTLWADNMGVRYIIPALPFLHLLGGLGLAALFGAASKWARPLAAALCAWAIVAAAGIYPDHLSYFNESACILTTPGSIGVDGGSKCGTSWLDDSNVDWGQGFKQLKRWQDVNAPGKTVRVGNPFRVNAASYGVRGVDADPLEITQKPLSGMYAVSAHYVARVPVYPGANDWLRRFQPIAVIGHALYIYEIP